MDAGQFKTLEEVIDDYNRAPEASAGHTELKPLNLSATEVTQVIAFLKTLSGPLSAAPQWLQPPN